MKRSIVVGFILAVCSLLFFLEYNQVGGELLEGNTFRGEVLSSVGDNKYDVLVGEEHYIVQSKKPIALHTTILGTVGKVTIAEKIPLTLVKVAVHNLVYGEFNYGRWLYIKGYSGAILPSGNIIELGESDTISYRSVLQNTIIEKYGHSKEGGLLQGMMIGGRRGIDKEHYTMFIDSGLVHIIAVSGSNIMMVVLLCNYILFFVPIKIRRVLLLFSIMFYFTICGMDSSIFRATIFAVTNICVLFYGGRISFVRLLGYSVTLLLCVNPFFLLYDLGFLLSISALVGLYFGSRYFRTRYVFLNNYILPSLFSTLGVIPVLFLFVGKVNFLSPVMTILLGPFLSCITVLGSMSLLVDWGRVSLLTIKALSFIYKLGGVGQDYGVYIMLSHIFMASIVSMCIWMSYGVIIWYKIKITSKHH